jgi:hypothetical protein
LTKLREERASAAEAIAEARRGDGDADLEDDKHAELDLLLDKDLDGLG